MIEILIYEFIQYGIEKGLVDKEDEVYCINRVLELLNIEDGSKVYELATESSLIQSGIQKDEKERRIKDILDGMLAYLIAEGMVEDTQTNRDLWDTKLMAAITPPPSVVRKTFREKMENSPEEATSFYYEFSKATNYIRTDRIEKDEKWTTDTEYGQMDITINLSKPEKDPKDIAKMGQAKASGYPKCLLCKENEGYAGHLNHPARGNHRIIPISLGGEPYYIQYSPYVYYNEHCILFNDKHKPMKVNLDTFHKLLEFTEQFPHYTAGSNADLPIVGGSILSHDHFQGGNYEFAMAKADYEYEFHIPGYENVKAGIIKWPMSVIRLRGENRKEIAEASNLILNKWKCYTDESAFIYCETNGEPHNTITPIARRRGNDFEIDLVLRNNITTEEKPWGVYHPTEDLHHIKKENIGLIEVMGLAILPARLKKEMNRLEEMILAGEDLRTDELTQKHADWAESFLSKYEFTPENIHGILQNEIGIVFSKVLECAGVYKRNEEGKAAFLRFINTVTEGNLEDLKSKEQKEFFGKAV